MSESQEIMRYITRFLSLISVSVAVTCATATSQAQISNFDARIEGVGVFTPDAVNGNFAVVKTGTTVTLTLSAQAETSWDFVSAGFKLYSPGDEVTTISHIGDPSFTSAFYDAFGEVGTQFVVGSWDGALPDILLILAYPFIFEGTFTSVAPVDVFKFTFTVPTGQSGTICIDSAFFPPAGEWFINPSGTLNWGATVGGYPSDGFCFTVIDEYLDCCDLAGDADHSGALTIGDVTLQLKRIFSGGGHPYCCREMDANGDGMTSIADVLYNIAYHFRSGPAPVCGPVGSSCGM